jgi:hypothetical protein
MKKLFDIGGDEMRRILSLHESSTQKQYLNVLNEGGVSSNVAQNMAAKMNAAKEQQQKSKNYKINSDQYFLKNNKTITKIGNDFKIFRGATFNISPKDPDLLVAKTKIQFVSGNNKDNITTGFDDNVTTTDSAKYTFSTNVYFRCSTQQFSNGVAKKDGKYEKYSDSQGGLKNELLKLCKLAPKSKNQNKKEETKVKQPGTKQPVSQEKQQTFAQQNVSYSNSIQTSLGVQPTGQITDSDLDNIISKLG